MAVRPKPRSYTLITGGAGFIGTNLARRLLSAGEQVLIYDNLSRPGVERNLNWLGNTYGDRVAVEVANICHETALQRSVKQASSIFHFAAQVAVTTSMDDPVLDFDVNVRGTFNLLETMRRQGRRIPLVFTSTNKVYGKLNDLKCGRGANRYEPMDARIRENGISESFPLDFRSPYGCSKGAADQYVLDYSRIYGMPTAVFRMSCIYGPHQFGTEDQGWVAHFLIQALNRKPIVLYGDGFQVRDVLFVDDLVDALMAARENIDDLSAQAFNIGGGPQNVLGLLELIHLIERMEGSAPEVLFDKWRTEDQKYYVSDISRFQRTTGWKPKTGIEEGLARLRGWLAETLPAAEVQLSAGKTVA